VTLVDNYNNIAMTLDCRAGLTIVPFVPWQGAPPPVNVFFA